MNCARKVVLVSRSTYRSDHDALLNSLLRRRILLFCAVGVDCERWEEAMDWVCVGPDGGGDRDVVTTSHPRESVSEVVEFARNFVLGEPSDVEIVEV
jgi:hypothetical protein